MYLSLYCKGSKRVTQGFTVRGSWRPNRTAIYWPPLLWPSALCLSRSPDAQPEARGSAFCWVLAFSTTSCQQLLWNPTHQGLQAPTGLSQPHLSNFSGPQLIRLPTQSGAPRAPSAWFGFPYHISPLTPTVWLPVITELYNSSTPTQSPTQSLEWHVWSSSSGNNCHAVHRSLSSGASLCSGTVGPSPCPILSAELTCTISFD